jgi:hypothetical protein
MELMLGTFLSQPVQIPLQIRSISLLRLEALLKPNFFVLDLTGKIAFEGGAASGVTWTGRTHQGVSVPAGLYTVVAVGNYGQVSTVSIIKLQ